MTPGINEPTSHCPSTGPSDARRPPRRVQVIDASKMLAIESFSPRVEVLVALLDRETLGERPGEAGDHAVVMTKTGVGLLAAVAARQGGNPHHVGVGHQVRIEGVELGQRQLEHDALVGADLTERNLVPNRPLSVARARSASKPESAS